MDESEDSICESIVSNKELDPSKVDFCFLVTGNSGSLGVLLTHCKSFKWHIQSTSRDGKTIWFVCAFKKHKSYRCLARATMMRREVEDPLTGETKLEYVILDISTPMHHSHLPDTYNIIADQILQEMKKEVERDPMTSTGM